MFQTELDVDETLAQLLVSEGFSSLEEVAYVEVEELGAIEGLDEEIAAELQSRAAEAIELQETANREARTALGVEDAVGELPHITEAMMVVLGKAGVRTLDDVGDLSTDELVEKPRQEPRRRKEGAPAPKPDKGGVLAVFGLSMEQGQEIIMAARHAAGWFGDEDASTQEDAPADAEG